MTFAEKLAHTFVKAASEKTAAPRAFDVEDIPGAVGTGNEGLRQEFEDSLRHEEVLRVKARDYKRLARERAMDQPGAATDFIRRLVMPYSLGEAAWRGPLVGAGGVGGYLGAEHLSSKPDVQEMAKAIKTGPKGESELAKELGGLGQQVPPDLAKTPAKDLSTLAGKAPLLGAKGQKLKGLGVDRSALREAFLRAASGAKESPMQSSKLIRGGGAVAGAGLASVLTGLPMALRGASLRRSGGELSQRARERMSEAVTKSEREQFRRENILRSIEGDAPLPLSEWKAQKKQMRIDFREAIGDYRDLAKARRKGERRHGAPIPAEGEEG